MESFCLIFILSVNNLILFKGRFFRRLVNAPLTWHNLSNENIF